MTAARRLAAVVVAAIVVANWALVASAAPTTVTLADGRVLRARGVLEWRFQLGPKTDADVRFAFEVRHPRSKEVYGLGE